MSKKDFSISNYKNYKITTMKQFIVNENKQLQEKALKQIDIIVQAINNATSKLIAETKFELSIDDIISLIHPSSHSINALHEKVNSFLDVELGNSNVTLPALIKNNLKSGTLELIRSIANNLKIISGLPGIEYLDQLSITDGKVSLSGEAEESIKAQFRNVIESDLAMEIWNKQNEAAEKLQELFTLINTKTSLEYYRLEDMMSNLFEFNPEAKKANISELDYERITRVRQLKKPSTFQAIGIGGNI
jgi:hypothetical protein